MKSRSGPFSQWPFAAVCPRRDAVVALKAPEMVDTHHIVNGRSVFHALLPPCKAGDLVNGPVVQRVAPQLSVCRKGVRRASGHLRQVHGAVGLEQLRVGPQVAGIRADIDGNIAHQPDALRVCVGLEGAPLGVEEKLHSLVVVDTPGKLCLGCGNGFRLAAAQRVRPVGKARLPLRGLHCHEQGIIVYPVMCFAETVDFVGIVKTRIRFFQNRIPILVLLCVIDCCTVSLVRQRYTVFFLKQSVFAELLEVNKVWISSKCRKALIWAVAKAGRANRQYLPQLLPRFMQKIDPIIGGLTECTNAIWRWQAEDGQQYTTASFHETLLRRKWRVGSTNCATRRCCN